MNIKHSKETLIIKGVKENGKLKYRFTEGTDNKEHISKSDFNI